ncbi:MAG: hypothetical protein HZA31_02630 [Opitutae bacterium]|nr:hypothetical protein [Opitutae bacterium]
MSTVAAPKEAPWHAGLRAARANLLPGLALQAVALGVVLAYYYHAPTHAALARLATLRNEVGVTFSIVSTGLCGGVLPFLYLRFLAGGGTALGWRHGAFLTAFWAYKGWEIEMVYRLLAWSVGEGHAPLIVLTKLVLDQFVYCPLFAVPQTVLAYAWGERNFSTRAILDDVRAPRWYTRRVVPVMISNIGVWVPAAAIIYSLPTPLQLPLQNVVLCFFTLLLAHLARQARR